MPSACRRKVGAYHTVMMKVMMVMTIIVMDVFWTLPDQCNTICSTMDSWKLSHNADEGDDGDDDDGLALDYPGSM